MTDTCPLCRTDLDRRAFDDILLEDRHERLDAAGDPRTDWQAFRRTLRDEHGIDVGVATLREHADYHVLLTATDNADAS